jgi:hypothetical protein
MRMETRPPGTHSGDGGFRSGGRTIVARLDRAKHAGKVGRNTRKGRAIYAGKVGRYTSSSDSERMCEPDEAAAHSTPFSYVDAQRLPDCFVSTLLAPGSCSGTQPLPDAGDTAAPLFRASSRSSSTRGIAPLRGNLALNCSRTATARSG